MGFYLQLQQERIFLFSEGGNRAAEKEVTENRVQISGYRYYSPRLGRWITRDPIREDGVDGNLYVFVDNFPVGELDILGLFGAGYPGGPGHGDFPGSCYHDGCYGFDYNAEDEDWETTPFSFWGIGHHFKHRTAVEKDLIKIIPSCEKDRFERLMHQGQDFFSHYQNGWRWHPTFKYFYPFPGHPPEWWIGEYPDDDVVGFLDAYDWTEQWVYLWELSCCKHQCNCRWVDRRVGPCLKE